MGSTIFLYVAVTFGWVLKGLIRYLNAKPGGLVVMLMGYGAFLVVQYYAFKEGDLPFFSAIKNDKLYHSMLVLSLGVNVIGLLAFIIGFFRVQGIWTVLSGL